jgi:ABC-type glutathione transport system ATPase component
MPEPVLAVEGLRRVFGGRGGAPDRIAVAAMSFSLTDGGSLAIVGESGSGKTTTLRMIAGLEVPTEGTVTLRGRTRRSGRPKASERRAWAKDVQLVFQDPYSSLDPRRTVREELAGVLDLHFSLAAAERDRRIAELLDRVGLSDRPAPLLPRALAGGERQRVVIARALAAEPRVLLLDEPVASLDVSIQAQILNLLLDVRASSGVAYVFVSHDLGVVRQVCDEILVMREGEVVERGAARQIFEAPGDPYTRLLLDCMPRPGWKPVSAS